VLADVMVLHPAAMLTLWAGVAVFVQTLPAPTLWVAALGVLAVALWVDRTRTIKLIRRIRILLVMIALMFAFATPGTAVFADGASWSPTYDGVALGATHAARLLAMVSLVSILLSKMPVAHLVLALHVLASALRPLGVSPERAAVRLSLVLAELDGPRMRWRDWLETVEAPATQGALTLEALPWRMQDHGAVALVFFVGLVWWWV
jgi:energy-coupling factor transporter transmembrane protein EcfT